MPDAPRLGAAVLLAAGGGTRFRGATHKLLAPFRGATVVRHAVSAAMAAALDAVIVVEGAVPLGAALAGLDVHLVANPHWARGPGRFAAGRRGRSRCPRLRVRHRRARRPALLHPAAWRAVAATTVTPVATALLDGRPAQPVRLAREVWDALPRSGDMGARAVIASGGSR